MDAARPGLGGKHMPDYLRLLTLAKDEGDVWKGKTNTAIRGSRNGSTGSTMIAQCLAAANSFATVKNVRLFRRGDGQPGDVGCIVGLVLDTKLPGRDAKDTQRALIAF
jgi:hypothetical protein